MPFGSEARKAEKLTRQNFLVPPTTAPWPPLGKKTGSLAPAAADHPSSSPSLLGRFLDPSTSKKQVGVCVRRSEKVTFTTLQDWTIRDERGINYYSGIATYRKGFTLSGSNKLLPSGLLGPVQLVQVALSGNPTSAP